ncbi:unnamed protein product [Moneuplotes crassus]|uniref:Uncharacterized protein n=1 Tax=Euplotes crassus TaxID=5936 RepID=A0AAD2D5F2_EUPCR|nr:unnamed protein product [Moneuplotes crassus]
MNSGVISYLSSSFKNLIPSNKIEEPKSNSEVGIYSYEAEGLEPVVSNHLWPSSEYTDNRSVAKYD